MTPEEFQNLRQGDIIVGEYSREAYIVTGHYGNHVTAVRTVDVTRPAEWQLIQRHDELFLTRPEHRPSEE